jgi:hypothetical protein
MWCLVLVVLLLVEVVLVLVVLLLVEVLLLLVELALVLVVLLLVDVLLLLELGNQRGSKSADKFPPGGAAISPRTYSDLLGTYGRGHIPQLSYAM